uniref:DNA replication complex GINS family protein n=1 Tax=Thermosphaera aggregans TaxID=54254 RepID=A0A7C2BJN3_9CREN
MSGLLELVEELVFKFMNRDFQEESVKIEVVSDGLKIFLEESYVELMKGSEYTVPRWMASRLESMNVCRVKEPDVTVEKLSQIVYLEETQSRKPQLTKLNGYFYSRLKQVISKLEEGLRTNPDWRTQTEALKMYSELYDALTRERITKIINLLNLMDIPQDISEKMSEEEKQLYLDLKTILNLHLKNLRMRGKHGGTVLKG